MNRALGVPLALFMLASAAAIFPASASAAPANIDPVFEAATDAAEESDEQAEEDLESSEEATTDALRAAAGTPSANRLPALKRLLHAKHKLIRRVRARIRELRALPLNSRRRINRLPLKQVEIHQMRGRQHSLRASVRHFAAPG
jgi:hypothetical protein